MSERTLEELAEKYWVVVRRVRAHTGPKRMTRFHKETQAEIVELLRQVSELRPGNHPMALMEEKRPDDMEPYYAQWGDT